MEAHEWIECTASMYASVAHFKCTGMDEFGWLEGRMERSEASLDGEDYEGTGERICTVHRSSGPSNNLLAHAQLGKCPFTSGKFILPTNSMKQCSLVAG